MEKFSVKENKIIIGGAILGALIFVARRKKSSFAGGPVTIPLAIFFGAVIGAAAGKILQHRKQSVFSERASVHPGPPLSGL